MLELQELDALPDGLLDCQSTDLKDVLGKSTLIRLKGIRHPALFVSVLLHGNETTGWEAVRKLLRHYHIGGGKYPLPRDLIIFFGNLDAAAKGMRKLDHQKDYNRVWSRGNSEESRLMDQVMERITKNGLFASIDIHNNTGTNPHYACINIIKPEFLRLALLFGRLVIYFTRPRGVQSMAMAKHCPSVTLECGKVGDIAGIDHVVEYIHSVLHLQSISSDEPLRHSEIDLYHTIARIIIPDDVDFAFADTSKELSLDIVIERFNFSEIKAKTVWGEVSTDRLPLYVRSVEDLDVSDQYFSLRDGKLYNSVNIMPSMLTLNEKIIRQDCLCYLMERYSLPESIIEK